MLYSFTPPIGLDFVTAESTEVIMHATPMEGPLMRLVHIITLACFVVASACAFADSTETYEVNLERQASVGQVLQLQGELHATIKTYVYQGTHEMLLDKTTKDLEYMVEATVLEVDDLGDPSALSVVIRKWRYRLNGTTAAKLPAGITIKATRDGDETKYEAEGIVFTPDVIEVLDEVFDVDPNAVSDQEAMGPSKRVKIRESWEINRELCATQAQESDLDIRAENVTGTGKLMDVKTEDGVECATVQIDIKVDKFMPPMPAVANATLLNGTMNMSMTGDVPMDETLPEPKMTGRFGADATLEADTPGGRQKIRFVLDTQRWEARKLLEKSKRAP
jgi:hypothetical protein